jgi:hypothetical protein
MVAWEGVVEKRLLRMRVVIMMKVANVMDNSQSAGRTIMYLYVPYRLQTTVDQPWLLLESMAELSSRA